MLPPRTLPTWKPIVIPDIRVHAANWRKYRSRAGVWPTVCIVLFGLRFVFVAVGLCVVAYFLFRHGFGMGLKAVAGRIFLTGMAGLTLSVLFAVDQTGRYIFIAVGFILSVSFFAQHDFREGKVALAAVAAMIFIALWSAFEQREWNRQLREKGLSSEHDVWSVAQFPLEPEPNPKAHHHV